MYLIEQGIIRGVLLRMSSPHYWVDWTSEPGLGALGSCVHLIARNVVANYQHIDVCRRANSSKNSPSTPKATTKPNENGPSNRQGRP